MRTFYTDQFLWVRRPLNKRKRRTKSVDANRGNNFWTTPQLLKEGRGRTIHHINPMHHSYGTSHHQMHHSYCTSHHPMHHSYGTSLNLMHHSYGTSHHPCLIHTVHHQASMGATHIVHITYLACMEGLLLIHIGYLASMGAPHVIHIAYLVCIGAPCVVTFAYHPSLRGAPCIVTFAYYPSLRGGTICCNLGLPSLPAWGHYVL